MIRIPKNTILIFLFFVATVFSISLSGQKVYTVEKLNFGINSDYDEITPVVSIDGRRLFFTRSGHPDFNHTLVEKGEDLSATLDDWEYQLHLQGIYAKLGERAIKAPATSQFNQDIWVAETDEDFNFVNLFHPGYPLNNALPNSICALTTSGNEAIVINQFNEQGGMNKGFSIVRETSNGVWTFPEPIYIDGFRPTGTDVSLTMSNDGQILIISMEQPGTMGKSDLYVSFKQGHNRFSKPKNMGPVINSYLRETTPFLSEDMTTLFFSSNRSGTVGGNDIFHAKRKDDTWLNWSYPGRFNSPINTAADESQPYFNANTGYLYFTSKREGSSDIYRSKIAERNPITVVVKGKIYNAKTRLPIPAKVKATPMNTNGYSNLYISDDGSYRMNIPKGVKFQLLAEQMGYIGKPDSISFVKSYVYHQEYTVNLYLEPMEAGHKIDLEAIYFERSKPSVLESSYPALDKLAAFLKQNYNIYIQIEGHTDNQGEAVALQQLSEERAEAIKHYLCYKKGIKPLRVNTLGYGGSKSVNDNSTEALRQENRRVEIIITDVTSPITVDKVKPKTTTEKAN
ncbi:MAG: OmpA family protein [Saprospiraceae bacterium]